MEKVEYRSVIKFLFLKNKTNDEIKAELESVYGDQSPSIATIKRWTAEFKRGRTSVFDEQRSGRPKDVSTPEIIKKVHDMVLDDRRIKVREIAGALHISYGSVFSILHNELSMKKLCARWVPRLLTVDNKRERERISTLNLAKLSHDPKDFWRRIITVDETWIHHYTPELKQQSKQWTEPGSSAPKKAKTVHSAGKVMATVFWDCSGVLLIDYLQSGKTITGAYYASLLDQLHDVIQGKRPHLKKKRVLFLQDNARVHTSVVAMAKIHELHFELLPHPPYSPDLAPSDFFLFPNLKTWLGGKRFGSNEEVISETNAYFEDFDKAYFSEGMKRLEYRWTKCNELQGEYVEK